MTTATAERRTTAAAALADTAVGLGLRAHSLAAPLPNYTTSARALIIELRRLVVEQTEGVRRPDEKTWGEVVGNVLRRERAAADGACPHCSRPIRRVPDQVTLDDVLLEPLPHPAGDVRIVDVAGYVRAARDYRGTGRGVRYSRHSNTCVAWPRQEGTCPVCRTRLHPLLVDDGIDTHPLCQDGPS